MQNKAYRIERYQEIALQSAIINTRLSRNRLGSKFRKCLYEAAEEYFGVTKDLSQTGGKFQPNHLLTSFVLYNKTHWISQNL